MRTLLLGQLCKLLGQTDCCCVKTLVSSLYAVNCECYMMIIDFFEPQNCWRRCEVLQLCVCPWHNRCVSVIPVHLPIWYVSSQYLIFHCLLIWTYCYWSVVDVPKQNSVFTLAVQGHVFTIYGNNFRQRASERCISSFKNQRSVDL